MKRFGMVLIYLGGCVWVLFGIVKYLLGWDVTIRQFLPYHLAAIIPGMALKYGYGIYKQFMGRERQEG